MSDSLADTLERLDGWLLQQAPAIHATLTPGASRAELATLEQHLGLKLPEAYRQLYEKHAYWGWTFGFDHIASSEIYGEWDNSRELEADFQEMEGHSSVPSGAIRTQYINLGWIPFLRDWSGNSVGIDLNPDSSGQPGQVVTFGRDVEQKFVLAGDLAEFLETYVSRLKEGRVRVELLTGYETPTWVIRLTDADGFSSPNYHELVDFYPGFGSAPPRREH